MVTRVSNNGTNTGVTTGETDLIFQNESLVGDLGRWPGLYNGATGVWTCPAGGMDDVTFEVRQRANVGFTLYLMLNGVSAAIIAAPVVGKYAYGQLTHTFKSLNGGDQVKAMLIGVDVVTKNGPASGMTVRASKR